MATETKEAVTGQILLEQSDSVHFINASFKIRKELPYGVYGVNMQAMSGELYLTKQKPEFLMPKDFYEVKGKEFQYVKDVAKASSGNLGIILNGVKGTGKTIFAEKLCNELQIPVLIMESWGEKNLSVLKQISDIPYDLVLFFDEFEKKFSEDDQQMLLSVIDGVYNTNYRRIFILTTNEANIDPNMLGRLHRFAYRLDFTYITDKDTIKNYFSERINLTDEQLHWLVGYMQSKINNTIDTFSKIVEEINFVGFDKFREIGSEIMNLESTERVIYCIRRIFSTYVRTNNNRWTKEYTINSFIEEIHDYNKRNKLIEERDGLLRNANKTEQMYERIKELNELIGSHNEIGDDIFFCKIDPVELQVKDKIYNNSGYRDNESYIIKERLVTKEGLFLKAEGIGEEDGDILFLQVTRSRVREASIY